MTARQFTEIIIDSITNLLKDNLTTVRDGIIADINSNYGVNSENASRVHIDDNWKFYISETSDAFVTPACYVIAGPIHFTQEKDQANYITGTMITKVSVIDNDRIPELATRRSFRYLSAVHEILHLKTIVSNNSGLSMTILVDDSDFSPVYSSVGSDHEFSKEVMLDCSVKFRQKL